ncbi:MAG: hypothetical protein U1F67_01940 [Rubrivivax sp.]
MPPLLKLWLDEEPVRLGLWSRRHGAARQGSVVAAPTGGPESSTTRRATPLLLLDAYLPPYEQTARLTGMRWLPPLVLHAAHRVHDAALAACAWLLTDRLERWPTGACSPTSSPRPRPLATRLPTARPSSAGD